MDLITSTYAQSLSPACAAASAPQLAAVITAASQMIETYCGRKFYAARYQDSYDSTAASSGALVLRQVPLVQLNSVTLWPDDADEVFTAADFDLRYGLGRITFKASAMGSFPWGDSADAAGGRWPWPQAGANSIQVDYFAGYGWVTALASPIVAGSNVTIPLANTSGLVPEQGAWNASQATTIVLDDNTENREEISVSWNSSLAALVGSPMLNHAAAASVAGPLAPASVQIAAVIVAGNILSAPDLTKKAEGVGRAVGYQQQLRLGGLGVFLTPEVCTLLAPYRSRGFAA